MFNPSLDLDQVWSEYRERDGVTLCGIKDLIAEGAISAGVPVTEEWIVLQLGKRSIQTSRSAVRDAINNLESWAFESTRGRGTRIPFTEAAEDGNRTSVRIEERLQLEIGAMIGCREALLDRPEPERPALRDAFLGNLQTLIERMYAAVHEMESPDRARATQAGREFAALDTRFHMAPALMVGFNWTARVIEIARLSLHSVHIVKPDQANAPYQQQQNNEHAGFAARFKDFLDSGLAARHGERTQDFNRSLGALSTELRSHFRFLNTGMVHLDSRFRRTDR